MSMLNHGPLSLPVELEDIGTYGQNVVDDVRKLPTNRTGDVAIQAGKVLAEVGIALDHIDALRRHAWSADGDLTRHDALTDALNAFRLAAAYVPEHKDWPTQIGWDLDEDDDG